MKTRDSLFLYLSLQHAHCLVIKPFVQISSICLCTTRELKRRGVTSSRKLNLLDPCHTVPCRYHCWGMPGHGLGHLLQSIRKYNAESPKQGRKRLNSIVKRINFSYLPHIYDFIYGLWPPTPSLAFIGQHEFSPLFIWAIHNFKFFRSHVHFGKQLAVQVPTY